MESRLRALTLALKAADIDFSIETRHERMRIQKAIYLVQSAGVSLGYRHAWYVYGPYSPAMTRDYYAISELKQGDQFDEDGWQLTSVAKDKIDGIKGLFVPPEDIGLDQPEWLELVASLRYLIKDSGYDFEKAAVTIDERKPHLKGKAEAAQKALKRYSLL